MKAPKRIKVNGHVYVRADAAEADNDINEFKKWLNSNHDKLPGSKMKQWKFMPIGEDSAAFRMDFENDKDALEAQQLIESAGFSTKGPHLSVIEIRVRR